MKLKRYVIDTLVYKGIKKLVYFFFTVISRSLPLWKEAPVSYTVEPVRAIPVTLPVNHKSLPEKFACRFIIVKTIPERRIFTLKNVYINGNALVFRNLRIFLPSLPWLRDLEVNRNGNLFFFQWIFNIVKIPDTINVALVFDMWSATNYYHWMIESLPRLLVVQEKYPGITVLVPEPCPEFIRTTVSLMGCTHVLPLKRFNRDILKAGTLVFPELVFYKDEQYPVISDVSSPKAGNSVAEGPPHHVPGKNEPVLTVRERLLRHFNDIPVHPKRKIFVSRSRQKTRRLINEDEVLPVLHKHGFEIMFFEEMSFREQVNIMLDTSVFCSIHGANMVNILFLQPGSKVVELLNKDYFNEAYYQIASTVDVAYYVIPCSMADKTIQLSDDSVLLNDAHLEVNVAELDKILAFD